MSIAGNAALARMLAGADGVGLPPSPKWPWWVILILSIYMSFCTIAALR